MKKIIAIICLIFMQAAPASASAFQALSSYEDKPASVPTSASDPDEKPIDFCTQGKLLIFTGNCSLPKNTVFKDSISPKACDDAQSILIPGLQVLYPQAKVYSYKDLEPDTVYEKLMSPSVLGFFLVGEGNVKGGLVTGKSRKAVYPNKNACTSKFDVFGGLYSHSKYSPDSPAPARYRRRMLARMEFLDDGDRSPDGSWPQLCGPKFSQVYPTRTFSGRMKEDVKKLIGVLMDKKRDQALSALESICGACDQYVKAGYPLAKLCPPNSDVCKVGRITPGSEKLVMDNYCLVLHPEYAPPTR